MLQHIHQEPGKVSLSEVESTPEHRKHRSHLSLLKTQSPSWILAQGPILDYALKHQRLQDRMKRVDKSELCMATFFRLFELATFGDLNLLGRLISHAFRHVLNLLDDIVPFQDLSKHNVLAIQPAGNGSCNEELVAVSDIKIVA